MANLSQWEKALLAASLLLLLHLGYRLIDQSQMVNNFPLDYANDVSAYMAQLHFTQVCDFHDKCPYWYNGFTTFQFSPPGWYYLFSPLYQIFGNVTLVTYLSIIILLILGLLILWKTRKLVGLSKASSLVFFALFFANASAIGNFIRLGRVHELLSWVLFIPLFFLLYHYREKKIDTSFFVATSILYAGIILSYQTTGVLASLVWLGFLLSRDSWKERGKTLLAGIIGLLISSFWLFGFVRTIFQESSIPHLNQGEWIWVFSKPNIVITLETFIIPFVCVALFLLFYRGKEKTKKNLLFFLPIILLAALFLSRITPFLPIFNQIYPDPIFHFLLFVSIFFLLKASFKELSENLQKLLSISIVLVAIASILTNVIHTPLFDRPDSPVEKEFISYIPLLQERFIILGAHPDLYAKAYYSFAATHNKKSASGWYPEEKQFLYIKKLDEIHKAAELGDCSDIQEKLIAVNTTEILTTPPFCEMLESCKFPKIAEKENTCFYKLTASLSSP